MSKKQSSIEWLFEQYKLVGMLTTAQVEKAKAMHKEEAIDCLINGMYEGQKMYFSEHKVKLDENSLNFCAAIAEHYYNETFGGQDA